MRKNLEVKKFAMAMYRTMGQASMLSIIRSTVCLSVTPSLLSIVDSTLMSYFMVKHWDKSG